jgi:subfamily B ATP-binding cassette protein MsbA
MSEHKKLFVVIFISMAIVAITSALSAYIFKYILNDIFISKDEKMLILLPIIVILLFSIRGVARFLSSYLTVKVGVSLSSRLRQRVFAHLVDAEYAAKESMTTGDISAVTIQTILNIQNSISKTLPQLIISALTIIALLVMIVYTDWKLSLYAITVGVLMIIPVKMLGKGVKRHATNSESMIDELSNRINETFNNFDLVKVYNKERYEKELFSSFLDRYKIFQIKLAKYQLLSSPFMEFFIATAIAVVIYVGGHYVVSGSMTAGDFFAFMVALMMLYAPIKNLTQNYIVLYMLNSFVQRVEQILSLPLEQKSETRNILEKINKIEFKEVSYSITHTDILHDISFEIAEGDSVAIVGKSGAGKSSIISLLLGLNKPSSGKIEINGRPMTEYSPKQYRDQISYVNQRAGIFNITIQDNILYGEPMDEARYTKAKQEAQCEFINQMPKGDQELAGEFGNRLSGGQRQRIALARAIYRGGSLFVLDEATSALDANTESLIQESLTRVIQEHTSIIIAHRLSTIEKCNKVAVMEAGKVVAYGSYEVVSQNEVFKRNFMVESVI